MNKEIVLEYIKAIEEKIKKSYKNLSGSEGIKLEELENDKKTLEQAKQLLRMIQEFNKEYNSIETYENTQGRSK